MKKISLNEKEAICKGLKSEIKDIKKTRNEIVGFLFYGNKLNLSYKQGIIIECALIKEILHKEEFLKFMYEIETY